MKEKRRVPVSFRLKKELHDNIESLVAANDKLTRAAVVEMALTNYFKADQKECLVYAYQEKILIPLHILRTIVDEESMKGGNFKVFTMAEKEYAALSIEELLKLLLCSRLVELSQKEEK